MVAVEERAEAGGVRIRGLIETGYCVFFCHARVAAMETPSCYREGPNLRNHLFEKHPGGLDGQRPFLKCGPLAVALLA